MLGKIQRRAALWILGAFKILPMLGIKAIVGLIPINLYLQKLDGRFQLRIHLLPPNHIICSLMELISSSLFPSISQHLSSLKSLTKHQCELVKGHVVDIDNRFNKVFSFFSPLHLEFSLGNRVINNFPDQFSFNLYSKRKDNNMKSCIQQLNKMTIESLSDPSCTVIIIDTSVKNDITMSILHTHVYNKPFIKTFHYAVYITSSEAELFTIRCGIN